MNDISPEDQVKLDAAIARIAAGLAKKFPDVTGVNWSSVAMFCWTEVTDIAFGDVPQ